MKATSIHPQTVPQANNWQWLFQHFLPSTEWNDRIKAGGENGPQFRLWPLLEKNCFPTHQVLVFLFYSCFFFFQSVSLGSPHIQLCFIFVYCEFGWCVVAAVFFFLFVCFFLSHGNKMPVSIDTRTSYKLSRMSNCGGNISYIGKASHEPWASAINGPQPGTGLACGPEQASLLCSLTLQTQKSTQSWCIQFA